jgi:DNA-binding MarR family transcriptional regulator
MAPEAPIRLGADFDRDFPAGSRIASECFLNLVRTGDLVQARVGRILRDFGLTAVTGHVLGIINGAGEPLSPHVIIERLLVSRATVTGLLDSLEAKRMIRRVPHPRDRRMLLVELTAEAHAALSSFLPAIHRAEVACMDGCLSRREQEELVRLLGRVQAQLLESRGP